MMARECAQNVSAAWKDVRAALCEDLSALVLVGSVQYLSQLKGSLTKLDRRKLDRCVMLVF